MNLEKNLNIVNHIESAENFEKNAELLEAVSFEDYEKICNINSNESRSRGILSSEMYVDIMNDPDTDFIESCGRKLPVLISPEHALSMGYDAERCIEYADYPENVRMLSLPIQEMNEDELEQLSEILKSKPNMSLYFSDHYDEESESLQKLIKKSGLSCYEKPMVDERSGEEGCQASLSLFHCSTKQPEIERRELNRLSLKDVQEYYEKNIGPVYSADGGTVSILNIGHKISDEQAEEMWNLYDKRFDYLGENHPISMQDSREDFLGLLRTENTEISSTYQINENGSKELVCFTYFVDDVDHLYWLNKNYLNNLYDKIADGNEQATKIFTPGIVSSGMGKAYSFYPLKLLAKACNDSGMSCSVLYENTNFSKNYIPKIVNKVIGRESKNVEFRPSTLDDEVIYKQYNISSEK